MVSFRAIVQYYSANSKTIEGEFLRVVLMLLLSGFDQARGDQDGQADTCRIRMAFNMR